AVLGRQVLDKSEAPGVLAWQCRRDGIAGVWRGRAQHSPAACQHKGCQRQSEARPAMISHTLILINLN
ncbi:MAG: hypothetical protein QN142_04750, partial [Armatimonadota bacterium]|nr:hypothetical protein [Armatimonadota bacterium]